MVNIFLRLTFEGQNVKYNINITFLPYDKNVSGGSRLHCLKLSPPMLHTHFPKNISSLGPKNSDHFINHYYYLDGRPPTRLYHIRQDNGGPWWVLSTMNIKIFRNEILVQTLFIFVFNETWTFNLNRGRHTTYIHTLIQSDQRPLVNNEHIKYNKSY